jgi:hypothetical protein
MREELDKKLCEKYPELFKHRHADPTLTPMAWGFDCGDGWYNLIDALCNTITNREQNVERDRQYNRDYAKMREAALEGDWSLFNDRYLDTQIGGLKNKETNKYVDWVQQQRDHLLGEIPAWLQNVEPVDRTVCEQVKEKFGGLRFYFMSGDEFVQGAVALAERMSYTICEECGEPGKLRSGGWMRTLCDRHAAKYDYTDTEDLDK